jgi:hypothetical protein
MDYENIANWTLSENKPNSKPIKPKTKPIAERAKLMQSVYLQRIMKNNADRGYEKTKPKQTQNKPNLSRRSLWRSRIKPNFNRGTCAAQTFLTETLVRRSFSEGGCAFGSNFYSILH